MFPSRNRYPAHRRNHIERAPGSSSWADQVLATTPTLPRSEAYRMGLIAAHSLQFDADALMRICPPSESSQDVADFQAGYAYGIAEIGRRGV